jgi:ethanolamine ammonia-lyase small subunit
MSPDRPDLPIPLDPFARLRAATPARIGLGQVGDGLPTRAVLEFQLAHALARDAVHARADFRGLADALAPLQCLEVTSRAPDRTAYLRRPDLGRQLDAGRSASLPAGPYDVAIMVGDGLSASAVDAHAAGVIRETLARLPESIRVAPVVLALGDDVGEALDARLVVVLIGERPGLSVADSLGAYLTFDPKRGRRDSERNCISNIHAKGGLSHSAAAAKLAWLISESFRLGLSGVDLKDDQDAVAAIASP